MGNMLTATVKVKGTRPMLWHKFGPESIPLEKQERTGVAGNDPEEWKRTVLYTKEGQLYIRPDYVFSCIVAASRHTKKGRGSIQALVAATLQVDDEKILIDRFIPGFKDGQLPETLAEDDEQPVYLDIRGVVNPNTRSRNVRYRVAASKGWETEFTIIWDCTIVSREQMQAVLYDAGRLVGLGNGRTVGFGRFSVEQTTIMELAS